MIEPYLGSRINLKLLRKSMGFRFGRIFNDFDIPEFLEGFRKKSYPDADLSRYSVKLHFGRKYNFYDKKDGRIWGDTHYQFILMYNDLFGVCLGFDFYKEGIFVQQIQGVPKRRDILKPIKWSNALLNVATNWAAQSKISEIWVLPIKRNKWYNVNQNLHNAKMYYDITAKREGFKYDEGVGVFRKVLN